MRAAVIDIGSSSIKLIIGERAEDDVKIIESLKNVLPIGKNTFFGGRIPQEIINQTVGFIEKYKQVLKEYEISECMVIATTAVREARNKDIFIDAIFRKTGFNIDVFNVGDVVYYIDSYLSQKLKKAYPINDKNLIIAELGAGSLDISVMEKGSTIMNVGFPIGTLKLKQLMSDLDGSIEEIYGAVKEFILNEIFYLKHSLPNLEIDDVILIDENYSQYLQTVLPSTKRESNFFQFKLAEAEEFLTSLINKNQDEISSVYKIPQDITDTIIGYAIVLNTLFKLTRNRHIYILETSLAEAILANTLFSVELSKKKNKLNQLISVANFLCLKYNLDWKHARHVAGLAEMLFNELKENLSLQETDSLYLILAAYLHDIGMFVNNRSHHKHSEYIISSLSLFRLTEEEIKIIACIARYHRRTAPVKTHILYNSLAPNNQILAQKLSAILRIANSLDRSHRQKVKKIEIAFNRKQDITLTVHTPESFVLEKASFLGNRKLFEEVSGNKINLAIKNPE